MGVISYSQYCVNNKGTGVITTDTVHEQQGQTLNLSVNNKSFTSVIRVRFSDAVVQFGLVQPTFLLNL